MDLFIRISVLLPSCCWLRNLGRRKQILQKFHLLVFLSMMVSGQFWQICWYRVARGWSPAHQRGYCNSIRCITERRSELELIRFDSTFSVWITPQFIAISFPGLFPWRWKALGTRLQFIGMQYKGIQYKGPCQIVRCLEWIPLRVKKGFKPRPQHRILVPLRGDISFLYGICLLPGFQPWNVWEQILTIVFPIQLNVWVQRSQTCLCCFFVPLNRCITL